MLAQLALRSDVPVERHGGDPEFAAERGHGGVAVRHRGLGQSHLGFRQRERPATLASARPRGREAGQGAFTDQLPLELGQRREDAEYEAAGRRGGVDLRALPGEHPQAHAAGRQILHGVDQVGKGAAERRKDAQVAREVRVAMPRELRPEDGRALVLDYAQRAFVDRGMVADIAFHGGQGENPHAHIMLTTRPITPEGFGQKDRSWNKKEHLVTWREDWAATANHALERHGHADRIDHRTLAAQRDEALARGDTARAETLDRDPEIHLGRAAWMEVRTGEANERTRRNEQIAEGNRDFGPSR